MTIRMITIFMLLALTCASCSKSGGGSSSDSQAQTITNESGEVAVVETPSPAPKPEPTPDPTPVLSLPPEAYSFETNVKFINLTASQKTKMNKALEIIKLVVATDEFKSKIINHTYGGKKTFVDNGGYANSTIYSKILKGAETLQTAKDNEMDLEVEMYTDNASNTVGYTYPSSKRIWVNTKFFNQYTAAGVAHNLFHEWLHKLGFTHSATYSKSRDYSVPYAIGYLVGEIGKDFL